MNKEARATFTISQGAVIENQKGEVLILKRPDGMWTLPGGCLDRNEDWSDGLRREIFEETGIRDFKIKNILNVYLWDANYAVIFHCLAEHKSIVLSTEHPDFCMGCLKRRSRKIPV